MTGIANHRTGGPLCSVVAATIPDYAKILLRPPAVLTIMKQPLDLDIMVGGVLGLCGIDPEKAPPPDGFTRDRPRVP